MKSNQIRARAIGAVLGGATGDALGAPFEFYPPLHADEPVEMTGGGMLGWEPGEWTDDTSMSIVVLAAALGSWPRTILDESVQDTIAQEWYSWSLSAPDIGILTRSVMDTARHLAEKEGHTVPSARHMRAGAKQYFQENSRAGGNGALMRTHVVAVATLTQSDDEVIVASDAIGELTHCDKDSKIACLLWTFAVRHAILTGNLDARVGLQYLEPEISDRWELLILEAEERLPHAFDNNGWVVRSFQAAWSAIAHAGAIPEHREGQREFFTRALAGAVRSGNDTDTIAAIAGSLLGAGLTANAIDPAWRRELHGWPGLNINDLENRVEELLDRVLGSRRLV